MRAIVIKEFGNPDVLKLEKIKKPKIASKQVLIRVKYTSVNFADIQTREGKYHASGKPPIIPGLDVAGIIDEIGKDVTALKVGQKVIAFPKMGSYAEFVAADENLTYIIPDNVDFETAAACPIVSFTSYKLLGDVARVKAGDIVLIHAVSGGIGTTAVQIAKILGASVVIGTVGSNRKTKAAIAAGADLVICHTKDDFSEKVNKFTDGKGADVILDSIGGEIAEKSLECLDLYGRLVIFGNACGQYANFNSANLHSSCRTILGFSFGTTRNNRPELLADTAKSVLSYLENGLLKMNIGKKYQLHDAAEAHKRIESRKNTGKIILKVNNIGSS